jgi:hypothetical protein
MSVVFMVRNLLNACQRLVMVAESSSFREEHAKNIHNRRLRWFVIE